VNLSLVHHEVDATEDVGGGDVTVVSDGPGM
jgi:hypothetical protein